MPPVRRPAALCPSRDDAPLRTRFAGVGAQGLVGFEVHVALDGKAERTAKVTKFVHADVAQFRRSHVEIAEAESDIVQPKLGQEPGALDIGREEFHDGFEVDVGLGVVHADDLRLAVGDELFGLGFGEECHVEFLV
jgi:hypothetical protein